MMTSEQHTADSEKSSKRFFELLQMWLFPVTVYLGCGLSLSPTGPNVATEYNVLSTSTAIIIQYYCDYDMDVSWMLKSILESLCS